MTGPFKTTEIKAGMLADSSWHRYIYRVYSGGNVDQVKCASNKCGQNNKPARFARWFALQCAHTTGKKLATQANAILLYMPLTPATWGL